MRKLIICVAMVSLFLSKSIAQQLVVTPDGLRSTADTNNAFVVIAVDGVSATNLYNRSLTFIHDTYKNPDKVIKGKLENESITFEPFVEAFPIVKNSWAKMSINTTYTVELRFKDGKARYKIYNMEMVNADAPIYKAVFSGGLLSGYPIYNTKGKLLRPDTKKDIEEHFAKEIATLTEFLQKKAATDNW